MTRSAPDSTETIVVLEKNARENVHCRVLEYHGRRFVDLRVFSGSDTRPLPTKKGLAFPVEQLPALIEALEHVREAAHDADDDPLTRQYRATMADGLQPGEEADDRMFEPNTILGAG